MKTQIIRVVNNQHNTISVFGIVDNFTDDEIKNIMRSLLTLNFLQAAEGKYPTLSVTNKGIKFLKEKELLELSKTQEDNMDMYENVPRQEIEYDHNLLEKLRVLRKQIADESDTAPWMIFSDISLQEMAHYFPSDKNNFSKIEGVGIRKLESFGDAFLEVINNYTKKNNISSLEVPDRGKRRINKIKRLVKAGRSRYAKTKEMVLKKLSLAEIAEEEGFKEGTIVNHIERLILSGEDLDIAYLKPPKNKFEKVKIAFEECGDEKLKPIFDFLDEEYSYDEIRLAKLFLK
jgi:ATP-dependent DNA helicase RecQ